MEAAKPRSAVDVIGPAVDRTKAVLFQPRRWGHWWRIALIGMATAVFGTANGCNVGSLEELKAAFSRDPKAAEALAKLQALISPAELAFYVTVFVTLLALLALVHVYVNSVARFMLFDALTTGAVRLRQGWSKWHGHGARLFGFQLVLALFVTVVLSAIALLFTRGVGGDRSVAWVGFLAFSAATWLFSLTMIAVHALSVDFGVPVMALEGMPVLAALRKVWSMAADSPLEYLFYLLMRLVLAVAVAIALLILQFFLLIIPLIIMVVFLVVVAGVLKGVMGPLLLVAVMLTGVFVIAAAILVLMALIAAPAYVFFQGYALEFFSDRYPPLRAALYPPKAPVIPEPPALPAM